MFRQKFEKQNLYQSIIFIGMKIRDKFEKYDLSLLNAIEMHNVPRGTIERLRRKSNVTSRVY